MNTVVISPLMRGFLGTGALGAGVVGTIGIVGCLSFLLSPSRKMEEGLAGASDQVIESTKKNEKQLVQLYTSFSTRILMGLGPGAFGASMLYAATLMGRVTILGTGTLFLKMPLLSALGGFSLVILTIIKINFTKATEESLCKLLGTGSTDSTTPTNPGGPTAAASA